MQMLERARAQDFDRINQLLVQLQLQVDHRSRRNLGAALAELSRQTLSPRFPSAPTASAAGELRRSGLVHLGQALGKSEATEVRRWLDGRPLRRGHVFNGKDEAVIDFETASRTLSHACYSVHDVLACPHLLELANGDVALGIAESYLGCAPTLYSVNAFWSFPEPAALLRGVQTFHRDWDDFRFCTLFLFLTDTDAKDGVHEYVTRSHEPDLLGRWLSETAPGQVQEAAFEALFRQSADVDSIFPSALRALTSEVWGPAGSAVMEDTFGLHRGIPPKTPRLLFWARYGLHANKTYFADGKALGGIDPTTAAGRMRLHDPYYAYVNRLLVR
jgi:hypothetical protein